MPEKEGGAPEDARDWKAPKDAPGISRDTRGAFQVPPEVLKALEDKGLQGTTTDPMQRGEFKIPEALREHLKQVSGATEQPRAEPKPKRPGQVEIPADIRGAAARAAGVEHRMEADPQMFAREMRVPIEAFAAAAVEDVMKGGLEGGFNFRMSAEVLPALTERLKDENAMGDPETKALVEEASKFYSSKARLTDKEGALLNRLGKLLEISRSEEVDVG